MRNGTCWKPSVWARAVFALAVAGLLFMQATGSARAGDPAPVFDLMDRRLELMKDVAAFKYLNGIAIEDLKREAVVLARAREKAEAEGLDGDLIERFFRRNIDAAKAIQHCWIEKWSSGSVPPPDRAPDLRAGIRPRLIDIGNRLTQSLATHVKSVGAVDEGARAAFRERVAVACLDGESAGALFDALREVRAAGP